MGTDNLRNLQDAGEARLCQLCCEASIEAASGSIVDDTIVRASLGTRNMIVWFCKYAFYIGPFPPRVDLDATSFLHTMHDELPKIKT